MQGFKEIIRCSSTFRRVWSSVRAGQLERRYRETSAEYTALAQAQGCIYRRDRIEDEVRARTAELGVRTKAPGEIHTAMLVLEDNWGIGMVYEAAELGSVSVFDWTKQGFPLDIGARPELLPELSRRFHDFIRESHREHPIDWVFIPGSGTQILRDTVRGIREELGVPVVNQWLDCKQNFRTGVVRHGQDTGQLDIAPEFDLVWTSSRSACDWYLAVGARPIYLPEGFSPRLTPRVSCPKLHDVGFLGACYGLRPDYVQALHQGGLGVAARGYGWPGRNSVELSEMGTFFGQCRVNLGMGGIGYSMNLTTLKGRDFEVPGAGGAYLTTFNPDLADFFQIGKEILCYQSPDEMVELAHRLVRDEAFREEIAESAYQRSMREHRWMHRFETILRIIGLL